MFPITAYARRQAARNGAARGRRRGGGGRRGEGGRAGAVRGRDVGGGPDPGRPEPVAVVPDVRRGGPGSKESQAAVDVGADAPGRDDALLGVERGDAAARAWFRLQIFKSLPFMFKQILYWSGQRLFNYFKIALRNVRKHKGYSLTNITGLALGMACCKLILLWVPEIGRAQV